MAKRKSLQPQLSVELLSNIGLTIFALVVFWLMVWGSRAFLSRSDLFVVQDVVVSPGLEGLDIPELEKIKGRNIFSVPLDKFEAKLHAKYPALSDLKVTRRLPDQIIVSAVKREPFARAMLGGHELGIDREGYLLGPALSGQESLPLIKGMRASRLSPGNVVDDTRFDLAAGVIAVFQENQTLASLPLRSVDISDTVRIVCQLAGAAGEELEVIVDAKSFTRRIGELGVLLSHNELDLTGVKYVDLRFGAPIIGQKKTKK